jgi:hypothetical protein
MKYDRVDLVADGANGEAHIMLVKSKKPKPSKSFSDTKSMGKVDCNKCGHPNFRFAKTCSKCGSTDLAKTLVTVTKTVQNPGMKTAPKNDDATNSTSNASGYTFEDEQYDQDNGENGEILEDNEEGSPVTMTNKSRDWFDVTLRKDGTGTEVGNVVNDEMEHQKEGEDSDEDIENLADQSKTARITRPKPTGYASQATSSNDSTMMTHKSRGASLKFSKKVKKEKGGLNSWDHGDEGSQEVAESAEQMYRAQHQPTKQDALKQESTQSLVKARRRKKSNAEGLDIIDHNSGTDSGIYTKPGVKRNGTGTGHRAGLTTRQRTAVPPPQNPLDKSRYAIRKSELALATLEALNLGVGLAENIELILKNKRPDMYETVVNDFLQTLNAAASAWVGGETVTKSKNADAQAQDVSGRVLDIVAKASPESYMSDAASEGENPDELDGVATNTVGKLKSKTVGHNANEKMEEVVGKNKNLYKSAQAQGDPYAGLSPVVKSQLLELQEMKEERTQEVYLAKARQMPYLVGYDEARVAKQLRDAYEESDEQGQWLEQTLTAASNGQKDSSVFKQLGRPGAGTSAADNPMAAAEAYADSNISKGADGPSREQLVVEYMTQHPGEFYQTAKSS